MPEHEGQNGDSPVDYYLAIERVADDLDEALAEAEREPRTDVWRSFWDRVTEGGPIPSRPAKREELQQIADEFTEHE